jgi:hypothetical protein
MLCLNSNLKSYNFVIANSAWFAREAYVLRKYLKQNEHLSIWKKSSFSLLNRSSINALRQTQCAIFMLTNEYYDSYDFNKKLKIANELKIKKFVIILSSKLKFDAELFDGWIEIDEFNENNLKLITNKLRKILYSNDLFISYPFNKEIFAENLQNLLRSFKLNVLLSNGHDFDKTNIKNSTLIVSLITNEFILNKLFRQDINNAFGLGKEVLMVIMEKPNGMTLSLLRNEFKWCTQLNIYEKIDDFINFECETFKPFQAYLVDRLRFIKNFEKLNDEFKKRLNEFVSRQ